MRELLLEIFGWMGYMERPAVLVQLVVAVGLMVLARTARRRRLLRRLPALGYGPIGLSLLALCNLLLARFGQPHGLSQFLGQLWLGWCGLHLLVLAMNRWLPPQQVHELDSRLLRPAYLLFGALLLISEVDSLKDLAVSPVGQLFGGELNAGKLFQARAAI